MFASIHTQSWTTKLHQFRKCLNPRWLSQFEEKNKKQKTKKKLISLVKGFRVPQLLLLFRRKIALTLLMYDQVFIIFY